jgi:hypothetical protein
MLLVHLQDGLLFPSTLQMEAPRSLAVAVHFEKTMQKCEEARNGRSDITGEDLCN